MQRISLTIVFLFVCLNASSQVFSNSEIRGMVISEGKAVPDVHVMNTTINRATITNEEGIFRIRGKLGDTLLISAVQFKKKTVVLNSNIISSSFIRISLEPFVNELDEVVLRPYDLSGDLSNDIQSVNTDNVVSATIVGLPNPYVRIPTQAERILFEATSGSGLVPLNPVLNAITGRTKYLKSVLARNRQYARTERVRAFYPDSVYLSDLKIPIDRIDDFMYYCEVDEDFNQIVDTHDRLKIWEFLKSKSLVYRENNGMN